MKKLLAVCLLFTTTLTFAQSKKVIECADEDVRAVVSKKNGSYRLQYFRNFSDGWIKMDDTKAELVNGQMFLGAATRLIVHIDDGKLIGELQTLDETCRGYCVIRNCTDYGFSK